MSKKKMRRFNYKQNLTLSQNFMTSRRLLNRIVQKSDIDKQDRVLEIGAGKGHLTQVLSERCGDLYSVELDRKLFEATKEKLKHLENVKLIHADFLDYPLPEDGDYKVFSNIPYFITTPIVERLVHASNPPQDIWLVVEKGAAKRFMGQGGESLVSLTLKTAWELKILYHFKREDFHPKPSVDSVLLHMRRKDIPDVEPKERSSFEKFIEHSLKFGLGNKRGLLSKKQIGKALKLANLPPLPQHGEILYVQWLCLYRCYRSFHGGHKK